MCQNTNKEKDVQENYYRDLKEVVKDSYFIGSYQRGYRWDKENVRELLEDIYEGKLVDDCIASDEKKSNSHNLVFSMMQDKEKRGVREVKYCLQPLVVKKIIENDKEFYSVIDGQQRLTTLFIILKGISHLSDKKFPEQFSIEYQSRDKSKDFLDNLSENSQANNIDAAYIKQTYSYAKEWFLEQNNRFINHLEDSQCKTGRMDSAFAEYLHGILLDEVRFIWDEIDQDSQEKEQKIFADRNTGKLELTDSELIKSLFMNPEFYGEKRNDIRDRQTLISELWDIYENELHKDDFWAFLPISDEKKKEYAKRTRIDGVFYLLIKRLKKEEKAEENWLFKEVWEWIKEERGKITGSNSGNYGEDPEATIMHSCWREVCNLIDGIKELYDNNELYNLLSLYKRVAEEDEVRNVYLSTLEKAKSQRANEIKLKIKDKLFSKEISNTVKKTNYYSRSIINILVAHNIAIINSTTPIERFAFKFFGQDNPEAYGWDKEHIYASNESYIGTAPLDEKISVLRLFSEKDSFKEYVNYLHNITDETTDSNNNVLIGIDALELEYNNKMLNKKYIDYCFEQSEKRYDKHFDIWRCIRLKEKSKQLLEDIDIQRKIDEIIDEKNLNNRDVRMEAFFQNTDYDNGKAFRFLTADYLYWDSNIREEFSKKKGEVEISRKNGNVSNPPTIKWHGYDVEISDSANFWAATEEDVDSQNNFKHNYYRKLLGEIYDNTGISTSYVSLEKHGDRKVKIVTDKNRDMLLAFLKGTRFRIGERIEEFFKKEEHIDPNNREKGEKDNYTTFAAFVNDNSMGNMMILPQKVNRDGKYRSANFDGKRTRVAEMENIFLPVASSNVLMGKYIDSGSGIRQWMMKERLAYLKDMIETMEKYYG